MKIKTIEYTKTFNLGNYSNERIGVHVDIMEGDNVIDAYAEAKKIVEKSHKFFVDLPNYETAKMMQKDPDNFTGRDIKRAAEAIEAFEKNYPEYISSFVPANRTLEQGVAPEEEFDIQF